MKKTLLIVLVVAGVGVLGLVGAALFYLGPLIKKGVETVGPQVTQVDVKLASAQVGLLSGQGSLKGLVVGNPPGYRSEAAFKLGEVSVAVEPRSVFGDKIHIKSLAILAPEITLEGGLKDNNLTRILANVQARSGSSGTAGSGDSTAAQKKLQLDQLVIRDARVRAQLTVPGLPPVDLTLPEITLANLGQGPEGITAGELTRQILSQLTSKALAAVTDTVAKAGKAVLENAAADALKSATDNATKAVSDAAGKGATDAANKALQGVGELLKGGK